MVYDPRNAAYTDALADKFRTHFSNLPRTRPGRATPTFFHHDLQRITVGEILENQSTWIANVASNRFQSKTASGSAKTLSIGILEEALRKEWISPSTHLDSNLFKAMGRPGAPNTKVLDLRLTNPRHLLETVSNVGFDIAGVLKNTASIFTGKRNVAPLGINKLTGFNEVFIGGDVYGLHKGNVLHLGQNQMLGNIGDIRHVPSILRKAQSSGSLNSLYEQTTSKTALGKLGNRLGVGTQFHEKRGGFLQNIASAIRTVKGVGSGDAVLYARDYKYHSDSLLARYAESKIGINIDATVSGDKFLKGKFHGRGAIPTDGRRTIPLLDRLRAYFSASPDLAVVKASSANKQLITKDDLFIPHRRAGIPSLESIVRRVAPGQGRVTKVTLGGKLDYTQRASVYASDASVSSRAYDFSNFLAIRLNKLASSSLLGIGFRPSGNLAANIARVGAIPLIYGGAIEGLKYADYAVKSFTGFSPINMAAGLYTNLRVGQQELREKTGIATASNYIENTLLPGVNTGLFGTALAAGAGLFTLGRTGSYRAASAIGAGLYGLFGGPNVGQDPDSLRRVYSGEEKVPVYKSRWWLLGYQPFKGEGIDHFAPSWYTRLINKPFNTSIYGSEGGYWRHGSFLPTPSNYFGLGWLLDPYAVEKRNYSNRPYPVTGGFGEELPIIGPMFADTVGSLIKPRRKMHELDITNYVTSGLHERGAPVGAASMLGLSSTPGSLIPISRPDKLLDRLETYANVALEPTGIWKFVLEAFGVKLDDKYVLADSSNISSVARQFYGLNLGGAFGETEFIRRFLMSDRGLPTKINQQINTINNTMPDWLPGSRSRFTDDRSYFTNFSTGDPYTKIFGGDYRLPGEGYEAVNQLHSGQAGVYSDVDKFLILSDVAPHSKAYYHYKNRLGALAPEWQARVDAAIANRDQKVRKFDFYKSYQEQLASINRSSNYIEAGIRNSWQAFGENVLAELPIIGTKFTNFRDPLEHYKKYQVEGETFADWTRPFETIVRPAFYDAMGSNPLLATAKGALLGGLATFGGARFLNPVSLMNANPVASVIGGGAIGGAASLYRTALTGQISGGYVPPHVQKEREVREYFDKIKYVKGKYLEGRAIEVGNQTLADAYRRQYQDTQVYASNSGDIEAYKRSLTSVDRAYFEEFLVAPDSKRDEILRVVPEHMGNVLNRAYSGRNVPSNADSEVLSFFEKHELPGPASDVWSPDVPLTAIQLHAIKNGINGVSDNIHRFDLYQTQEKEARLRYPGVEFDVININNETNKAITSWLNNTLKPVNKLRRNTNTFGIGPNVNYSEVNIYDERREDVFSFYNQAYR
jgi:hypothetical protein